MEIYNSWLGQIVQAYSGANGEVGSVVTSCANGTVFNGHGSDQLGSGTTVVLEDTSRTVYSKFGSTRGTHGIRKKSGAKSPYPSMRGFAPKPAESAQRGDGKNLFVGPMQRGRFWAGLQLKTCTHALSAC